ncbi:hypothetical protein BJ166DRAFT_518451 [Pestalotiopsis sp. NC0098]|nr:hypothetical protein BJ166DRAFT_518451 [Pestalotiopsis sp. NC0098]
MLPTTLTIFCPSARNVALLHYSLTTVHARPVLFAYEHVVHLSCSDFFLPPPALGHRDNINMRGASEILWNFEFLAAPSLQSSQLSAGGPLFIAHFSLLGLLVFAWVCLDWAQVGTRSPASRLWLSRMQSLIERRGFCIPSCFLVPELRTGIGRDVGGLSDDGLPRPGGFDIVSPRAG